MAQRAKKKTLSEKAQKLLVRLKQDRDEKSLIEGMCKEHQTDLIPEFKKTGVKTHKVETDEGVYTGTLVEASRLVFNEAKLKKALGSARWNKVTTRVLDTSKLEDLIAEDEKVADIAAKCSDEIPNSPYIKVSFKQSKGGRK